MIEYQDIEEDRAGRDITASDMILPEEDSDIKNFYKNSTVLVTGATGFLGKLCVEKILRACPEVKKIYIIVRPKKGKNTQDRFNEMFEDPSFDPLKRKFPQFKKKLQVIIGDIGSPDLGISDEDREKIIENVDCIFHFAATVRFDEKLRVATNINVRGVRDLLKLCRQMKKLRVLVHVSTAYSNCNRKYIGEKFYDPPFTGEKLITLVDCLDDDQLDFLTPRLLGDFPNTYVYTKCIAEDIVKKESKSLPVAVIRPSIVVSTSKEPIAGWIDNVYGATGVFVGSAIGLLRVMPGDRTKKADIIPADYVVNSCLAVAWDTAKIKNVDDCRTKDDLEVSEEHEIPMYNSVTTPENPITWDTFQHLNEKHAKRIPTDKCIWYFLLIMCNKPYLFGILNFLLHMVPAYLVDFVAICLRKKPMLVKVYQKVSKFVNVIGFFALREWDFDNNNLQALWKRMKPQDKELFEFSMKRHNWDMFFYTYTRGSRLYIIKDALDTIPRGRVKYAKLKFAHYALLTILAVLCLKLLMYIFSFLFL